MYVDFWLIYVKSLEDCVARLEFDEFPTLATVFELVPAAPWLPKDIRDLEPAAAALPDPVGFPIPPDRLTEGRSFESFLLFMFYWLDRAPPATWLAYPL